MGVSFKHTEPMCGGMAGHHLLKRRVQEGHLPSTEVEEPTSEPACCMRSLVSKGTNTAVPPEDAGSLFLSESSAFPPALQSAVQSRGNDPESYGWELILQTETQLRAVRVCQGKSIDGSCRARQGLCAGC